MSEMKESAGPVLVYGMRRTGTNVLVEMLRENYDCRVPSGPPRRFRISWKHGAANHERVCPDARIVVCTRDPLAWLPSLYRLQVQKNWVHPDMSFAAWAAGDWMQSMEPRGRWTWGNHDVEPERWEGVRPYCPRIFDYCRTYGYWLYRGGRIVHHEDIVLRPEATCGAIADDLGLKRTTVKFHVPGEYVGPRKRDGGREGCVRRVREKAYLTKWTPEALKALRVTVDPRVILDLGYDPTYDASILHAPKD